MHGTAQIIPCLAGTTLERSNPRASPMERSDNTFLGESRLPCPFLKQSASGENDFAALVSTGGLPSE